MRTCMHPCCSMSLSLHPQTIDCRTSNSRSCPVPRHQDRPGGHAAIRPRWGSHDGLAAWWVSGDSEQRNKQRPGEDRLCSGVLTFGLCRFRGSVLESFRFHVGNAAARACRRLWRLLSKMFTASTLRGACRPAPARLYATGGDPWLRWG